MYHSVGETVSVRANYLLANETTNRGITNAKVVVHVYQHQTKDMIERMNAINETLFSDVTERLRQLKSAILNLRSIQQKYLGAESWVLRVTEIENEVVNASHHLESVLVAIKDFLSFFEYIGNSGRYKFERRILFGSLHTIILIVMIPALTILSVQSRRGFLLFGALAVFIFIICWCLIGATVAFNIVNQILADVCTLPIPFLVPFLTNDLSRAYLFHRFTINSNNSVPVVLNPLRQELRHVQTSIEQVPVIINGVSCVLGQNAGENSASFVQILTLCERVQRNFYDLLKELGSLDRFLNDSTGSAEIEEISADVCMQSSLSAFILLCATLVFACLQFILLVLNRSWRRQQSVASATLDARTRACCRGGAGALSSISYDADDLYVTGGDSSVDPFLLGNCGSEAAVPVEFYGTHMFNPRANQQRGLTLSGPEHDVNATDLNLNNGLWRTTPPPAYECVPLLRSQARQQRP